MDVAARIGQERNNLMGIFNKIVDPYNTMGNARPGKRGTGRKKTSARETGTAEQPPRNRGGRAQPPPEARRPLTFNESQLKIYGHLARASQRDAEAAFAAGDTKRARGHAARADKADAEVRRYERRIAEGRRQAQAAEETARRLRDQR